MKRWARNYECCQICGTTEIKHQGHGLCRKCHAKVHRGEYPSHSTEVKRQYWERFKQRHPEYVEGRETPCEPPLHVWARKNVERARGGRELTCAVNGCNEPAICHHPDYSYPLQIIPLCHSHHRLLHNGRLNEAKLEVVDLAV